MKALCERIRRLRGMTQNEERERRESLAPRWKDGERLYFLCKTSEGKPTSAVCVLRRKRKNVLHYHICYFADQLPKRNDEIAVNLDTVRKASRDEINEFAYEWKDRDWLYKTYSLSNGEEMSAVFQLHYKHYGDFYYHICYFSDGNMLRDSYLVERVGDTTCKATQEQIDEYRGKCT